MNTQNVNIKTAAQESSRKMGEKRVTNIWLAHSLALASDQHFNIKTAAHESAGHWADSPIVSIDTAHALALILDTEIDELITERMHIDRCSYEGAELYWRLQSWQAFSMLPDREVIFDSELLLWVRNTARSLLGNGYLPEEFRDC